MLGHQETNEAIQYFHDKINAVLNFSRPDRQKELGRYSWDGAIPPSFHPQLRFDCLILLAFGSPSVLSYDCVRAFQKLKQVLTCDSFLGKFQERARTLRYVDNSGLCCAVLVLDWCVGAVLVGVGAGLVLCCYSAGRPPWST